MGALRGFLYDGDWLEDDFEVGAQGFTDMQRASAEVTPSKQVASMRSRALTQSEDPLKRSIVFGFKSLRQAVKGQACVTRFHVPRGLSCLRGEAIRDGLVKYLPSVNVVTTSGSTRDAFTTHIVRLSPEECSRFLSVGGAMLPETRRQILHCAAAAWSDAAPIKVMVQDSNPEAGQCQGPPMHTSGRW